MKLILMRHMKSDWDGMTSDHARPLNPRGRASASKIGFWLENKGFLPDLALVSDSQRTRETFDGLAPYLSQNLVLVFTRALYLAEPAAILAVLAAHKPAPTSTVLLLAHNPGIAALAATLVEEEPRHPKFYDYPTGATTVLEFDGEIAPHKGKPLGFVIPREL
ncbi:MULTISPECIES: SixA phosphatase family protein [Falsihalocynthiibacter]|uniref:SixA phosphatase family protein n=1 Tax=Falsihalocynthiibacter TaxID=2854182 RepID=UPI003002C94F